MLTREAIDLVSGGTEIPKQPTAKVAESEIYGVGGQD